MPITHTDKIKGKTEYCKKFLNITASPRWRLRRLVLYKSNLHKVISIPFQSQYVLRLKLKIKMSLFIQFLKNYFLNVFKGFYVLFKEVVFTNLLETLTDFFRTDSIVTTFSFFLIMSDDANS